jgi:hypothetical protein
VVDLGGRKLGSFFGTKKKSGKFRQGVVLRRTGTWCLPKTPKMELILAKLQLQNLHQGLNIGVEGFEREMT